MGDEDEFTTIKVSKTNNKELNIRKYNKGYKDINDVITELLEKK